MSKATDMSRLLDELHEDHRNMAILLGLVEDETQKARQGGEPDFELLDDIMHYMTIYSDAVHHPKEDIIYAKLRAAGEDYADGLDRVESEHQKLARLGTSLKEACEAALSGVAVVRDQFVGDVDAYVERLRSHMRWEESDLFERAHRLADESIDVSTVAANDPLFGAEPNRAFEGLLARVRQSLAS